MAILVPIYDTATGLFRVGKVLPAHTTGKLIIAVGAFVGNENAIFASVGGGLVLVGNGTLRDFTFATADGTDWLQVLHNGALILPIGATLGGALNANSQQINNLPAPVAANDAARKAYVDGRLPSGIISMWHGLITNIPAGYVICDGNNSTPNLLTRFVQGVATAATNPGAIGGATAKTTAGHIHTMPSHIHTMPTHKHTMPTHKHTIATESMDEGVGYTFYVPNSVLLYTGETDPGDTNLTDPGDTNSRDPGDANSKTDSISDIRPKFYDIAFLMKT